MSSTSNVTGKVLPSFISSGEVTREELNNYIQMIKSLRGRFLSCSNDQFINISTHVICFSFFSSLKIMGGLASGKWLVNKRFVDESFKAGKWLDEETFEMKDYNNVARFLRLKRRKVYDGSIFYVEGENMMQTKTLKRVLVAGGATVMNRNDIVENSMKVECAIAHPNLVESVKALVGESTPILSLEYIKETIIFKHDPRNKEKFLLNPHTAKGNFSTAKQREQTAAFMSKFSKPIAVGSPCTPSKERIRRRTTATKVQQKVASYFVKQEGSKVGTKKTKFNDLVNNSDIEIIKEVIQNDPDCFIVQECVSKVTHINLEEGEPETKDQHNIPERSTGKPEEQPRAEDHTIGIGQCGSATKNIALSSIPGPVENANVPLPMVNKTQDTNHFTIRTEPSKNILQEVKENVNRPKNNSVTDNKINSETTSKTVLDENMKKERELACFQHNKKELNGSKKASVVVDFDRIKTILQSHIICLNTSFHFLSTNHISTYPYPSLGKAVKELCSDDSLYLSNAEIDDTHIVSQRVGLYRLNRIEKTSKHREETMQDTLDERLLALESLEWVQLSVQPNVIPSHAVLGVMIRNHIVKTIFRDVSDRALSIFRCVVSLHPPDSKRMRDYYMNVFQKASVDSEPTQSSFKIWMFMRTLVNDLIAEETRYDVQTTLEAVLQLLELDLVCYNECPVNCTTLLSYRVFWAGLTQNPSIMNEAVRELIKLWVRTAQLKHFIRKTVTKLVCIMFEMMWKCGTGSPYQLSTWPLNSNWMSVAHVIMCQFKELGDSEALLCLVSGLLVPWHRMLGVSLALRSLRHAKDNLHLSLPTIKCAILDEVKCCARYRQKSKTKKKGEKPKSGKKKEEGDREEEEGEEDNSFPHPVRMRFLILLLLSYTEVTGIKHCKSVLINQFCRTLTKNDVFHTSQKNNNNNNKSPTEGNEGSSSFPLHEQEGGFSQHHTQDKLKKKRKFVETPCGSSPFRGETSSTHSPQNSFADESDENMKEIVKQTLSAFGSINPTIEELNSVKANCRHLELPKSLQSS